MNWIHLTKLKNTCVHSRRRLSSLSQRGDEIGSFKLLPTRLARRASPTDFSPDGGDFFAGLDAILSKLGDAARFLFRR